MKKSIQPFSSERKQTDDSLIVERGKTDESFDTYKGKAETETDEAVSRNRLEADKARAQRRSVVDDRRDSSDSDTISNENLITSDQNLQMERLSEDSAIKKERSKNDLAIERERGIKERILSELVSLEREATDKNLLDERAKTDTAAVHSAELLTIEHEAHLDTKSALTTREEFIAIVSHDLRNPIGAILSFAEMLSDDVTINKGDDAKQFIEIIKRNAQTSLRLISDILDMERITEGKIQLQVALHRLEDVIKESIESNVHIASAKRIQLEALPSTLSRSFQFDRDRIAQVLSNIIGNALKFTPEGGTIVVKAEESETEVNVSISDSGPGIPETQKKRIFERFAQLHNKDRRGLGLGLYISKTLVESHGGKLSVTSVPGKGSTFFFTLPK
jgi:signal transduction histidine kinase